MRDRLMTVLPCITCESRAGLYDGRLIERAQALRAWLRNPGLIEALRAPTRPCPHGPRVPFVGGFAPTHGPFAWLKLILRARVRPFFVTLSMYFIDFFHVRIFASEMTTVDITSGVPILIRFNGTLASSSDELSHKVPEGSDC
jgi:hypothetical protein